MEMKSSVKQYQSIQRWDKLLSFVRHRTSMIDESDIAQATWSDKHLVNLHPITFYLNCNLYNRVMTLVFWSLSQESLPYPRLVLGWLFVCQHECIHCWDSGRWASSSILCLPVPWRQALIKWTSALPCTISVTVQPANKTRTHPAPAVTTQRTKLKTDLKHLLLAFQKCHKIKLVCKQCVVLSVVLQ